MRMPFLCFASALAAAPSMALAQFQIDWYTIDGGGGDSSGGAFFLSGTIGQPDAGNSIAGGAFQISGGFWPASGGAACYANCDDSTTAPIVNALDFGCFLSKFAASDPYANCDNSTTAPILNALDFGCFLSKFAAGCP